MISFLEKMPPKDGTVVIMKRKDDDAEFEVWWDRKKQYWVYDGPNFWFNTLEWKPKT